MEIWYPDHATWEATMARLAARAMMAEIVADKEMLFDRSRNRFDLLDEYESDLG